MLTSQKAAEHIGKTVTSIEGDGLGEDLIMCETIKITFTDNSIIRLTLDWRGQDCYISQRMEEKK